ncbi:Hypothetical_protein [Hexamita inflata]|uniref:Hypothetical_protein n=1 Tax=Hexamita inflata TaxID=28002 RepID=A0AA86TM21_9EUKA|nr:Hypothetical protein HINF_LOCUS10364 [Hexamita inflata]
MSRVLQISYQRVRLQFLQNMHLDSRQFIQQLKLELQDSVQALTAFSLAKQYVLLTADDLLLPINDFNIILSNQNTLLQEITNDTLPLLQFLTPESLRGFKTDSFTSLRNRYFLLKAYRFQSNQINKIFEELKIDFVNEPFLQQKLIYEHLKDNQILLFKDIMVENKETLIEFALHTKQYAYINTLDYKTKNKHIQKINSDEVFEACDINTKILIAAHSQKLKHLMILLQTEPKTVNKEYIQEYITGLQILFDKFPNNDKFPIIGQLAQVIDNCEINTVNEYISHNQVQFTNNFLKMLSEEQNAEYSIKIINKFAQILNNTQILRIWRHIYANQAKFIANFDLVYYLSDLITTRVLNFDTKNLNFLYFDEPICKPIQASSNQFILTDFGKQFLDKIQTEEFLSFYDLIEAQFQAVSVLLIYINKEAEIQRILQLLYTHIGIVESNENLKIPKLVYSMNNIFYNEMLEREANDEFASSKIISFSGTEQSITSDQFEFLDEFQTLQIQNKGIINLLFSEIFNRIHAEFNAKSLENILQFINSTIRYFISQKENELCDTLFKLIIKQHIFDVQSVSIQIKQIYNQIPNINTSSISQNQLKFVQQSIQGLKIEQLDAMVENYLKIDYLTNKEKYQEICQKLKIEIK